jgi:hypothetical protein
VKVLMGFGAEAVLFMLKVEKLVVGGATLGVLSGNVGGGLLMTFGGEDGASGCL